MSKGYLDYFSAFSKSSAMIEGRGFGRFSEDELLLSPMLAQCSIKDLKTKLELELSTPMHGLSYSPYMDGQSPGEVISVDQIKARMEIIRPYTNWIRTFSCIEGLEHSPRIAHEMGLKTMVGVNIGEDEAMNEKELENGIALAKEGYADILAIGNEVLLRGDVSEDDLLDYIARAKSALPNQTIAYVDAYFLFENHPRITEACDVLLINCYPFWEGTPVAYALSHVEEMVSRTKAVSGGKPVIISETGWPSQGTIYGSADPGLCNALGYFVEIQQWARSNNVPVFYFAAFDEAWKTGDEGDVGAYWGLWDSHGQFKFV